MFVHSGMLKLKDDSAASAGPSIKKGLTALVGIVPGLTEVSVGLSAKANPGTASLMFLLKFDSEEDWRAYADHPAHQALVKQHIAPALEDKHFFQTRDWESRSIV